MGTRTSIAIAAGLLSVLLQAMPVNAADPAVTGLWEQADDDGHVGGWFLIFEQNGLYWGALARMFPKPGEDPNPICTKCPGDQGGQPSIGLVIIKGLERTGRLYENGTILDPRDRAVYRASMELSPDGQKLTLRGFVGISLLGKSQVWTRPPDNALPRHSTPPNLLPYLSATR